MEKSSVEGIFYVFFCRKSGKNVKKSRLSYTFVTRKIDKYLDERGNLEYNYIVNCKTLPLWANEIEGKMHPLGVRRCK